MKADGGSDVYFSCSWDLLWVLKFRKHNNAFVINHVRVTTDECDGRVAGGVHHFHLAGFDNARFGYDVNLLLLHGLQDDLVAGLEFIQIAEDLAENVVMPGQDHIVIFTGVGRRDVLGNALFQLLPAVALYDRPI